MLDSRASISLSRSAESICACAARRWISRVSSLAKCSRRLRSCASAASAAGSFPCIRQAEALWECIANSASFFRWPLATDWIVAFLSPIARCHSACSSGWSPLGFGGTGFRDKMLIQKFSTCWIVRIRLEGGMTGSGSARRGPAARQSQGIRRRKCRDMSAGTRRVWFLFVVNAGVRRAVRFFPCEWHAICNFLLSLR